ncbi:MAG: undecaprenyl diphosphate synthase family protein, partial [Clostridiales bacterium]|nr:undecaprenyl diphosphate synthase family protein [Clostridiales bacterium]
MDGNGRWAKRRGLPRSAGHRAGANTIKKLVEDCDKIGLKYLTAYT